MGSYGFRSGYVEAQNIKAGVVTVPDGQTSLAYTFDEPMQGSPAVVATPTESGESAFVDDTTVDSTGFTVDGLTSSGANDVQFIAIDSDRTQ